MAKVIRYKKAKPQDAGVIGMLYLVDVKMVVKSSGELIKQKLLLVGCELADIENKIKWVFDQTKYSEFKVSGVEKVREKVHVISTVISQPKPEADAIIERNGESKEIHQTKATGLWAHSRRLLNGN